MGVPRIPSDHNRILSTQQFLNVMLFECVLLLQSSNDDSVGTDPKQ